MVNKVLVANRGEIAIRVMRACRELAIPCVAVYSEADKDALFVKYADEAYYIGPTPATQSYLNIERIMETARKCQANAIHPGYGFLAQNPKFARACESQNVKFIGPSSKVLELMGSKLAARRELGKSGIPIVPGTEECISFEQSRGLVAGIGYPVMVKPSGGGGGIGLTVVNNENEFRKALEACKSAAATTFASNEVYAEKYITHPRHIEIQVLADMHGNVIHLGERECSIQRRHQKLIEETPSTALTPELRQRMGETAVRIAQLVGYESAGTMEFLFSNRKFYFLEANTRIQVEHPVTEFVTGVDIVKEQILMAYGAPLRLKQEDIKSRGSAIECRINAEDPLKNFAPSFGKIIDYLAPSGIGVRVDSGLRPGYTVPYSYDSLVAKLIVWGEDRTEAIARMHRALYEFVITGIKTNIPFHKAVMQNQRFINGDLETGFIEQETGLEDAIRAIIDKESTLETRLSGIGSDKKRLAAIAAVTAMIEEEGKQGSGLDAETYENILEAFR